jgi:mono/diheme cytochrome c family protein
MLQHLLSKPASLAGSKNKHKASTKQAQSKQKQAQSIKQASTHVFSHCKHLQAESNCSRCHGDNHLKTAAPEKSKWFHQMHTALLHLLGQSH